MFITLQSEQCNEKFESIGGLLLTSFFTICLISIQFLK